MATIQIDVEPKYISSIRFSNLHGGEVLKIQDIELLTIPANTTSYIVDFSSMLRTIIIKEYFTRILQKHCGEPLHVWSNYPELTTVFNNALRSVGVTNGEVMLMVINNTQIFSDARFYKNLNHIKYKGINGARFDNLKLTNCSSEVTYEISYV